METQPWGLGVPFPDEKGCDHAWPWEELTGGVRWGHLVVLRGTIVCVRGFLKTLTVSQPARHSTVRNETPLVSASDKQLNSRASVSSYWASVHPVILVSETEQSWLCCPFKRSVRSAFALRSSVSVWVSK